MDLVPLLKALSEASGISGYEDEVAAIAADAFEPLVDDLRRDAMGNLIGLKCGTGSDPRRRIMLAGHMDEIGLMVTQLEEGFIRFTQVGGFDVRTLPGQHVLVHGRRPLPGLIGCRPPHVLGPGEAGKVIPMDKLFIDVGLAPEALEAAVQVGDLITIKAPFRELKGGRVCGKAFDDRAAVAAIAVCLELLQGMQHEWDVYAVATVQEEVGLRGAFTSTFGILPDIGIAIDVGFGKQPGVGEPQAVELGEGPSLSMGPNIHPALFKSIKSVADDNEVPLQTTVAPRGTGTDANAMQITRAGIPTALLSIPERNMHTPIETLTTKDVTRTGRLLALFIASLDDASLEGLAWDVDESEEEDA